MPTTDAIEAVNDLFHDSYAECRDETGKSIPILVLLAPEVIVCSDGQRRTHSFARESFDCARSAAHIAVALWVSSTPGLLETARRGIRPLCRGSGELADETSAVFELCERFARSARSEAERRAFAQESGKRILRLTELATAEQLAALHDAVERALGPLDDAQRNALHVVVAGDHQARRRSLGMQYFARRLARERLIYGENIRTVEEALKVVGTHCLDHRIAEAFFGDAQRLQEDILGAATEKCLEAFQLESIGAAP